MNTTLFKNLIKESVRDVFREELKDIIVEVLKSNNGSIINENQPHNKYIQNSTFDKSEQTLDKADFRKKFQQSIEGDNLQLNENDKSTFRPRSIDVINGELPSGNVGLDQIMGLLTSKE